MKIYKIILLFSLLSCSVVEDYKYLGVETIKGTIEYEFNLHEHFVNKNNKNECFYYHDTIVENYEITIDDIKKIKKVVWYKKSY